MGMTNSNGFWIGWSDLLITPLQSLVITINYSNSQEKTGSILVSLCSALNYDFILIWTASYIAFQYPRKRLLIPQWRVGFQESISVEPSFIFVSQETCSVTSWFPRIRLYVCHSSLSNGCTCQNIFCGRTYISILCFCFLIICKWYDNDWLFTVIDWSNFLASTVVTNFFLLAVLYVQ
jgi:hypothetical protein